MTPKDEALRSITRRQGTVAVSFLLAVAALLGSVAVPAKAEDSEDSDNLYRPVYKKYFSAQYGENYWLTIDTNRNGSKVVLEITSEEGIFEAQSVSDSPSGHSRVFLREAGGSLCLDDHAVANGGDPQGVSCNGGDYQIWEVFYQDNGTRVFKSWGAWSQQGRHLCLAAAGDRKVIMSTCNANSPRQQWYLVNF